MNTLLNPKTIHGKQDGPSLLVLGSVHGNEKCGALAIRKLMDDIHSGALKIQKGHVTFVDVCNPKAFDKNVRYIDENLNRIVKLHDTPSAYEERLANELASLIEAHDYTLDIHSNHTDSKPFAFLDYPDADSTAFCQALPMDYIITGWPELFYPEEDYTTLACAHRAGKKSVTIECGAHIDPNAVLVAEKSILSALLHLGMIEGTLPVTKSKMMHMHARILKEKDGHFVQDWQHLDPLSKGDIIVIHDDGTEITSPFDGFIFMPCNTAQIGDEWFYIAQKT